MKIKSTRKNNKKGISLIVLVITIIVMVILAGAIILTLNNSGIIQNASDAVDKTNEATVKEVAQLGWAEAYAEYGADQAKLEEGVNNALTKNNINVDDYAIVVTTSGVTIKAKKDMWVKEGFTVVKGDQVLKIGDTINYNAGVSTYTAGWKVLGVDDEGNLLIMSAGDVKTNHRLGYESTMTTDAEKLAEGQNDWLNGVAELDSICEAYGYGKGAVGKARSITVEDVNAVTGYDPETVAWGKGTVNEYGNEVTYAWDGDSKIKYSGTLNDKSGSEEYSFDVFTWYDEKTESFLKVNKGDTTTSLPTFKSTSYVYTGKNLTTISVTENKEAFEMLFGTYIENGGVYGSHYWLASQVVYTNSNSGWFGLRFVDNYTNVNYSGFLWNSYGVNSMNGVRGVRAVVTLSSDINFKGSSETGWSY